MVYSRNISTHFPAGEKTIKEKYHVAEAGNTANLSFKDLTGIAVESVYGHLETGKPNPCYILV